MQTHFEKDLAGLKEKLLTMASYAETAVRQAVEALTHRDAALAARVKDGDEIIDRFEVEIDELAVTLLARAPLASDLRLIAAGMKISQNLERVGDEATKIAKRARDLAQEPPLKQVDQIPALATQALQLLRAALDSFVHGDPARARAIVPEDKAVDAVNRRIHQELVEQMMATPDTILPCLHLIVIAKSLERIADHAKNIAEEVVYLYEATDIRHTAHSPPPATDAV